MAANSPVTTLPEGTPTALRPASRGELIAEVLIVLSLSILASVAYAIIDLLSAPIVGQVRPTFSQAPALSPQIVGIVFALAPVALVFYLARRDGEGLQPFGLGTARLPSDAAWGAVLAVLVSSVGLVIYVVSVRQGLNRFIVPVPPTGFWWTIPILVLGALRAALLEEVILVGYFIRRLRQLGVAAAVAVGASALIRASYHLYQGWGGFAGNLALGVLFGWVFTRFRRTWPLVVAHFLVDTGAGLAYLAFRGHCLFGICIP